MSFYTRLQNISNYRQLIMGLSILWIILFHSQIDFGEFPYLESINFIKSTGYAGVDVFFFLSGFSLAAGWSKKKYSLIDFYQKRFLRILPGYLMISILMTLFILIESKANASLIYIFSRIGGGFLFARNYDWWFIPSIICCYVAFPLLVYFVNNSFDKKINKFHLNLFIAVLFLPLLLSAILAFTGFNVLLIFSSRLPNFILGAYLGVLYFRAATSKKVERSFEILLLPMFVIGSILFVVFVMLLPREFAFNYGFLWYPLIFLTLPFSIFLGLSFKSISNVGNASIDRLLAFLNFCGSLSYELFLSHGFLFNFAGFTERIFNSNSFLATLNAGRLIEYFLLTSLSFMLAILLNRITRIIVLRTSIFFKGI